MKNIVKKKSPPTQFQESRITSGGKEVCQISKTPLATSPMVLRPYTKDASSLARVLYIESQHEKSPSPHWYQHGFGLSTKNALILYAKLSLNFEITQTFYGCYVYFFHIRLAYL